MGVDFDNGYRLNLSQKAVGINRWEKLSRAVVELFLIDVNNFISKFCYGRK